MATTRPTGDVGEADGAEYGPQRALVELQAEDLPPHCGNHQLVGAPNGQADQSIDVALTREGHKLGLVEGDRGRCYA